MKSRIRPTIPKKALGLNLTADKCFKLVKILSEYNIVFQPVENNQAHEQIGYLCGFKGFEKSSANQNTLLTQECLIFTGIENKEITQILKELKNARLFIDLKAVVTANNQRWTLEKLVTELEKEHIKMNGGGKNG